MDRIRRAEPADSLAIAGLHGREIPWGLLSQLGVAFVATFYQALLASPQVSVLLGPCASCTIVTWQASMLGRYLSSHSGVRFSIPLLPHL